MNFKEKKMSEQHYLKFTFITTLSPTFFNNTVLILSCIRTINSFLPKIHNFCRLSLLGKFITNIWAAISLAKDHKWSIPMASILPQALTQAYWNFSPVARDRSSRDMRSHPKKDNLWLTLTICDIYLVLQEQKRKKNPWNSCLCIRYIFLAIYEKYEWWYYKGNV